MHSLKDASPRATNKLYFFFSMLVFLFYPESDLKSLYNSKVFCLCFKFSLATEKLCMLIALLPLAW